MTLEPGQETTLDVRFSMHEGMGGPHRFAIEVPSSDPVQPVTSFTVAASYPRP